MQYLIICLIPKCKEDLKSDAAKYYIYPQFLRIEGVENIYKCLQKKYYKYDKHSYKFLLTDIYRFMEPIIDKDINK